MIDMTLIVQRRTVSNNWVDRGKFVPNFARRLSNYFGVTCALGKWTDISVLSLNFFCFLFRFITYLGSVGKGKLRV